MTQIIRIRNKIPDISSLVKKTDCNTKITEIEGKIPDVTNLATRIELVVLLRKQITTLKLQKLKIKKEIELNNHNHDKYITSW